MRFVDVYMVVVTAAAALFGWSMRRRLLLRFVPPVRMSRLLELQFLVAIVLGIIVVSILRLGSMEHVLLHIAVLLALGGVFAVAYRLWRRRAVPYGAFIFLPAIIFDSVMKNGRLEAATVLSMLIVAVAMFAASREAVASGRR